MNNELGVPFRENMGFNLPIIIAWAFQLSAQNAQTGRQTYLGGASLITAGIVVTAAHKVL